MRTRILFSQNVDGRQIINKDGNKVGQVHSLIVDLKLEKILFAILEFAGNWIEAKDAYFAIPLNALRFNGEPESNIILDMKKKELQDAPKWNGHKKSSELTNEFISSVFDYYDYNPYPAVIYD